MVNLNNHGLALQVLVGSHNYNLNTEKSDKDWKYFVFPTVDDLIDGKKYHKSEVSETEDYTIHDIRLLSEFLWKANLNFMEILYSKETYGYPRLQKYLNDNRVALSCSNMPKLYKACMGTALQKQKEMLKDSPARHESIEKFGYDTKSACHAIRLLDFVHRFSQHSFEYALWYTNYSRKKLIDIKNGERSLDYVLNVIDSYEFFAKLNKNYYLKQKVDRTPYDKLYDYIKLCIREELHF